MLCVLQGNLGISKNKVLPKLLWNFVPNSELGKFFSFFHHGMSIVASFVNLLSSTGDRGQFIRLIVDHYSQKDGRDAARCIGSSATGETCCTVSCVAQW